MLSISPEAKVSPLADIEPSVKGTEIRIDAHAVIDSFVKIKPAGGSGHLHLGSHSYLNAGCVLYTGNGIEIGANVLVAANCTFAPVNHAYGTRTRSMREQGFAPSKGGIVVEDDVWIGANTVILDGARIRTGVVVAAGSVVRGELAAYGIYGGVPAKLLRQRPE
jgi:virginiamycin A acetyltransferase